MSVPVQDVNGDRSYRCIIPEAELRRMYADER
jgi:hypothetical protein